MQVDDAERGFSYRDGPLDMCMDRSRGRTAAEVVATIAEQELCEALRTYGDEPEAERVAAAIVAAREQGELRRTGDLRVLLEAARPAKKGRAGSCGPAPGKWNLHPAAPDLSGTAILVNRELANLEALLARCPPVCGPAAGWPSSASTAARTVW